MNFNRFWTAPFNPVLPTVFSEDLSYYEFVEKIFKKMQEFEKEVISNFNEIEQEFQRVEQEFNNVYQAIYAEHDKILNEANAYSKNYTDSEIKKLNLVLSNDITQLDIKLQRHAAYADSKFSELSNEIKTIENNLNTEFAYLKNDFDDLEVQVREQLTEFSNQIAIIRTELQNWKLETVDDLKNIIEVEFAKIKEEVGKLNGDFMIVTNPTTNKNSTLYDVLHDIWEKSKYGSLTASEYDFMQITAGEYELKKITADDYDKKGIFVFLEKIFGKGLQEQITDLKNSMAEIREALFMFSPISGKLVFWKDMILEMVNKFHRTDSLTAENYDSLQLQAGGYDGQQISAEEYDFHGKNFVKGNDDA